MKYKHTKIFKTMSDLKWFAANNFYFISHKTMEVKYTYNNTDNGKKISFQLDYTLVPLKKEG